MTHPRVAQLEHWIVHLMSRKGSCLFFLLYFSDGVLWWGLDGTFFCTLILFIPQF